MTARGGLIMEDAELDWLLAEFGNDPGEHGDPGKPADPWPPVLNGITAPAKTWAHPATIAVGVARLQRDYPGWSIWVSSTGRIWAAFPVSTHQHCGSGQTLDADNPRVMRAWLKAISEGEAAA